MCSIIAKGKLNGRDILDIAVINPGDWFGRTWLLEIGGSYSPLFFVVEADSVSDAIDELADDPQHGHHIIVDDADPADYPEEDRHYGPSGQVIDLDWLSIHGQEGLECPWPCRYFGEDLPADGILPTDYWRRDEDR